MRIHFNLVSDMLLSLCQKCKFIRKAFVMNICNIQFAKCSMMIIYLLLGFNLLDHLNDIKIDIIEYKNEHFYI